MEWRTNVANLPSAKKRMKQAETRQERNRARKSALKTETRKLLDSIHDGEMDKAKTQFQLITKHLDQITAKGTMHKKTASRKKSRLAKQLNAAVAAKS